MKILIWVAFGVGCWFMFGWAGVISFLVGSIAASFLKG